MSETTIVTYERRRSGWDIAFGVLAAAAGLVVLGHVAFASLVSVLFLGWMLLIGGVVVMLSAARGWGEPGHWWTLTGGAVLAILGLGFLRSPEASLAVVTLLAGCLLLAGGAVRLVAAFQPGAPRAILLVNGVITLALGLLVLYGWPTSALWFLGVVLGVELLMDGITLAVAGRVRVTGHTLDAPTVTATGDRQGRRARER